MARPQTLTNKQKEIIDANMDMFPAEIMKLPNFNPQPEMNRNIVRNYMRKQKPEKEPDVKEVLAENLQRYLDTYGLPSRFHGKNNVTGFLQFLKQ